MKQPEHTYLVLMQVYGGDNDEHCNKKIRHVDVTT